MKRNIILGLIAFLVVIQFFRPERNTSIAIANTDIRQSHHISAPVQSILEKACMDCHSDNTTYPWYTEMQPIAWYMADHINEGKAELNFSKFASYSAKKAHHKLEEVEETIEKGEMPIYSYTLLHPKAKLSEEEKTLVVEWAKEFRQQFK